MGEGLNKLKLLYLIDILETESDDEHKLSMKDILHKLDQRGVKAERKAINNDIKLLRDYKYDIVTYNENREGYFMASRDFSISELRLLMDAVLSAKFISLKQSKELINKLKKLTSQGQAKKLDNQIYIDERIKTSNNHVCENVDKISEAINLNKKISFQYYTYTLEKKFVPCREGYVYKQSPYSLAWHDDKYYMISAHEKYDNVAHYRVDKMRNISILEEDRRSFTEVSNYKNGFDTANYLNKVFNMYSGEEKIVRIKFHSDLINAVIEKFGEDTSVKKIDEDYFEVRVKVLASKGFLTWVLQFGNKAEIISPDEIRGQMKNFIKEMYNLY